MAKELRLESQFESVQPSEFYRFVFPEGSFERRGCLEDHKGNGLAICINEDTKKSYKTVLTDGLEQLGELLEQPFVVCSPVSYFGRSRRSDHARWLYALTLDIDYVGEGHLGNLIKWFSELDLIPKPTFLVNSGHGVHLYYVFDEPIAMYPENQKELLKLKRYMVNHIWTKYTSKKPDRKEVLGIVQGFRMVGSATKLPGYRLSAFKTGDRVSVEYLNSYVFGEADKAKINQKNGLSLAEAKERYPEWYEKRIVKGEKPGRWYVKRDLYDWFLKRIKSETTIGHRYFCMMCLAIYAQKCGISREELREDAIRLHKEFDEMGNDTREPFGWDEAEKALEAYNESYVRFPRETIERLTDLPMPANKRNGRKQAVHLRRARAVQEIDYPNGEWRGRPKGSPNKNHPKKEMILEYKNAHPEANHSEIARALGISRPTVIKWLKVQ